MLQPRTESTVSLLATATPYDVGRRLLEATADKTGLAFFDAAVVALSHVLGARFVFITRAVDAPPTRVHVLAAVRHDKSVEPWTFELEGTPCEAIYAKSHRLPSERGLQIGLTVVDDAVCDRFEPARGTGHRAFIGLPLWDAADTMIGHVALFFDEPIEPGPLRAVLLEIVRMYAMRIEGELNRLLSDEAAAQALQVARAATEAQSFFTASISHELRTPLTGILGIVDLLARTQLDDRQRDLVSTIRAAGTKMKRLLDDLLDLAKADGGHMTLEQSTFGPREGLLDVLHLFAARAEAKGLTLRVVWHGDEAPQLRGDPMRLFQIVSNLVGNAIKFTELGEVRIEAQWSRSKGLMFEVRDTGPGIPAEVIPRLGVAFQQADPSVARTHGGTGLGLALSRQLIEAMGGTLEIESELGAGSCFRVVLPLAEAAEPAPEEDASDWPIEPLSGWALVVEDDPVSRMVVGEMLRQLGLSVVLAGDPTAAVSMLGDHVWRLIVTDMHLPVLTGAEFVARARAAVGAVPRVVMLTGDGTAFATERAMAAGADAVLLKPIDPITLARIVRG